MAKRKAFLLRLPPDLYEEVSRWAADELRSVNGHVEWILRDAVRRRSRPSGGEPPSSEGTKKDPAP